MASEGQDSTPYVDALLAYSARDPGRFQVPGHKGGPGADPAMRELVGEVGLRNDIPSITEGVDIGPEPTPFQQAQELAAAAWGARRCWFLINGASQGNHTICLALAHSGERVVVQRNVHSSVIDGLVLSGMRPSFAAPELDPELGIAHCLTPDSLAAALDATPGAVAAMVVSPTYFGACADVAALAEVAHRRGVPLAVDEAWGAHLRFHPDLPPDALGSGADVVVSSTHKIVGSLTQAAMLHLGEGGRIDEAIVDRCVSLVETTSPSALLSGSLDAARRQASVHGDELLGETLAAIAATRRRSRRSPGSRSSTTAWSAGRGSPAGTRCGSRSTCAAPARPATGSRKSPSSSSRRRPRALLGEPRRRDLRPRRAGAVGRRAAGRRPARGGRGPRRWRARRRRTRTAGAAAALGRAGDDPARGLPRAAGGGPLRAGRRPDRRRVAGRLPARDPQRAARASG